MRRAGSVKNIWHLSFISSALNLFARWDNLNLFKGPDWIPPSLGAKSVQSGNRCLVKPLSKNQARHFQVLVNQPQSQLPTSIIELCGLRLSMVWTGHEKAGKSMNLRGPWTKTSSNNMFHHGYHISRHYRGIESGLEASTDNT